MILRGRLPRPDGRALLGAGMIVLIGAFEVIGAAEWLRYDRGAMVAGEWWRLLSAHLVHLGPGHAVVNAAALMLLVVLVGRYLTTREWLATGILSALAVSLGVWWLLPEIERFVGLSGTLHGLMVAGAMAAWPHQRALAGTILGFVLVKLAWEWLVGPTPGTAGLAGGHVLVESHLYGASAGLACGLGRSALRTH